MNKQQITMEEIIRLKKITDQLRNPIGGCEWDLKQDYVSMREDLLEEVYELIDAVNQNDLDNIEEELGDVLFLILFYVRLGEEQGHYDLSSVAKRVADKLVRRHPHVFGDTKINGVDDILKNWDKIKEQEKIDSGRVDKNTKKRIVQEQAYGFLPALQRAQKINKKAAATGFDWPNAMSAFGKLTEEISELKHEIEITPQDKERLIDELGDVLFTVTNVARHLGISAELSLHQSTEKFIKRFNYIEDQLVGDFEGATLEQMNHLWDEAKVKL